MDWIEKSPDPEGPEGPEVVNLCPVKKQQLIQTVQQSERVSCSFTSC